MPAVIPREPPAPALGLTEDNASLLWSPSFAQAPGGAVLATARERLTALHPRYIRLLVNWAALQPQAGQPPSLDVAVDGCARAVAPCASYAGMRDELAAIAGQQRAARAAGGEGFQVVLDILGVPSWAAAPARGCELDGTRAFSRPLDQAGLAGYRSLIRALLALGRSEGVSLAWWSPWNEPNNPTFLSPQRKSCAIAAPLQAPAVYAQLAEAMASELAAAGGDHHLLLGELAAYTMDSIHRASMASFIAALPARALCLGDVWSLHVYPTWGKAQSNAEPVALLERALDARGSCAARAAIWITETGAGAPHPGRPRPAGPVAQRLACEALGERLLRWSANRRVGAVFQYSFREDPAFPVGLLSADLRHTYPTYRLWLSYERARSSRAPLAVAAEGCA